MKPRFGFGLANHSESETPGFSSKRKGFLLGWILTKSLPF
jgi:hypothetical protein